MVIVLAAAQFILAGSAVARPPSGALCGAAVVSANGLTVEKNLRCRTVVTWEWSLAHSVGADALTLSRGQQFNLDAAVTATARSETEYRIRSRITLSNLTPAPITINAIEDNLAEVHCDAGLPHTLKPFSVLHCWYEGTLTSQPDQNIVEVVRQAGPASQLTQPVEWPEVNKASKEEIDECALLDGSEIGQKRVCAGEQDTFSFSIARPIGPYEECGSFTVLKDFSLTASDTGTRLDDVAVVGVKVPCDGGCTLPTTYWQALATNDSGDFHRAWEIRENGAAPFLDTNRTYQQVLAMGNQNSSVYTSLAQAYLALDLNQLGGAAVPDTVQRAFDQAALLLSSYAKSNAIQDPVDESLALYLTTILEDYNNGLDMPAACSVDLVVTP